ncbi:C45 family autoproteolytic acyltransferase/hydrolase [Methanomicrobium antiquum]|uniref:C45 family autoproteolytic acyltransferase/hydrolase n=1 Tax=Methanomicrobium antiquum TaxID=487686 RepID=A0AAF0JUI8_9EURY|nr:C45 family peptidase [Methanomicrobium antiquum]WFN37903.1 C45 family autoproteolytic acyltransferase/hydrolase [Methanomicrobium antiquum]
MKSAVLTILVIILFIIALFIGNFALFAQPDDSGAKTTVNHLLKKENGTYMDVIHVTVRGGTEEEIGYELGKAGIDEFDSFLLPFADIKYGEEKEQYIKSYDDVLYERMLGIKKAYQLSEDDYSYDASFPIYISLYPSCSALYFPPSSTKDGHAIVGRNMEWDYTPDLDAFTGIEDGNFEDTIVSEMGTLVHVVEIYPDEGYASLVLGTMDLLNGIVDGINEKGLYVASLQDGDTYNDPLDDLAGSTSTGLNFMQVLRSILEHCATVDEAKKQLSETEVFMPYMGQHFLICDDSGDATIVEFDNETRDIIFIDYQDTPVPITNYAIHLRPDISLCQPENPDDPHDDYLRSAKLHNYISGHEGDFTTDDAWAALKQVEANADAGNKTVDRLLWRVVTDLTNRTMTVKYFLKDGPINNQTLKTRDLIMSEPFTFSLER